MKQSSSLEAMSLKFDVALYSCTSLTEEIMGMLLTALESWTISTSRAL